MTDEIRQITLTHPGDVDAEPEDVAPIVAANLVEATEAYADFVRHTILQVRSSYLSRELSRNPATRPDELSALWESSHEAKLCIIVAKNARAALRGASGLAEEVGADDE
jgi:hypothetical protein